ncbi:hypothetical protein [Streptomyces sp. WAC04114]|uniref:hypothetical protein n=1 Tax=Streptomyces sp. WAC04114 TaxID=2867961 RepID=UPI0027DF735F|nr:hypothetical protein [Streptomyces sp. WAC04114]
MLLYPMNALATDQAGRIGDYLAQRELVQVTAGLYIGDKPDTDFRRVMTRREEMRQAPPSANGARSCTSSARTAGTRSSCTTSGPR